MGRRGPRSPACLGGASRPLPRPRAPAGPGRCGESTADPHGGHRIPSHPGRPRRLFERLDGRKRGVGNEFKFALLPHFCTSWGALKEMRSQEATGGTKGRWVGGTAGARRRFPWQPEPAFPGGGRIDRSGRREPTTLGPPRRP